MGNLRSVQKGFEKMGHAATVTRDAARIEAAGGVVLPGVGAFGACMDGLAACGLVDTVHRVVECGVPFLGICVGMQILFSESMEFGRVRGLDILKGKIVRFDPTTLAGQKIPHMGWNQLQMQQRPPHLDGVAEGASVYFVHSYYPVPDDARDYCYDHGVWAAVCLQCVVGQYLCHPVSSGKKPGDRPADSGQFRHSSSVSSRSGTLSRASSVSVSSC